MTRWLQAALSSVKPQDRTDITDETVRHRPIEQVASVVSVSSDRQAAVTAFAPPPLSPRQDHARPDAHGWCHTWTGRVVRLDEWRQLSAWDRHGPAGRLFCGICKAWVCRDGGCDQAGCWKAQGGAA